AVDAFPAGREDEARQVLADALARGEARHFAVKKNLGLIDAVREAWRRSGGKLPRLSQAELAALYKARLAEVHSLTEFKQADLDLSEQLEALSPRGRGHRTTTCRRTRRCAGARWRSTTTSRKTRNRERAAWRGCGCRRRWRARSRRASCRRS